MHVLTRFAVCSEIMRTTTNTVWSITEQLNARIIMYVCEKGKQRQWNSCFIFNRQLFCSEDKRWRFTMTKFAQHFNTLSNAYIIYDTWNDRLMWFDAFDNLSSITVFSSQLNTNRIRTALERNNSFRITHSKY